MTSPPARLASGFRTRLRSTDSQRNRTLPSLQATLHPPGWLLPMLMSLKLLPPLYRTVRMALNTFFIAVQSLFQAQPRGHARSDPGDSSRFFQATSNTISVLVVPSVMSVIFTVPSTGGRDDAVVGWYGSTPSTDI